MDARALSRKQLNHFRRFLARPDVQLQRSQLGKLGVRLFGDLMLLSEVSTGIAA